jgi:hypothetical protein
VTYNLPTWSQGRWDIVHILQSRENWVHTCNPRLRRQKQEDGEFEVSMRYIERPCLKNKRQIKEELKEEKEKRRD